MSERSCDFTYDEIYNALGRIADLESRIVEMKKITDAAKKDNALLVYRVMQLEKQLELKSAPPQWIVGEQYVDRKGFRYKLLDIGHDTVTFSAAKASGEVCIAGRGLDGRYTVGKDHDYDIVAVWIERG